jgi:hypothetical protein
MLQKLTNYLQKREQTKYDNNLELKNIANVSRIIFERYEKYSKETPPKKLPDVSKLWLDQIYSRFNEEDFDYRLQTREIGLSLNNSNASRQIRSRIIKNEAMEDLKILMLKLERDKKMQNLDNTRTIQRSI